MCKHFYFIFQRTVFQQPVYTAKKVGVKVERITIKHLKNRWGSMTKQGSINLNVNLVKAPEDIIDYIILHELCHLKIKEHSYHYWDHVRRYMPNYQKKIEWLNKRKSFNLRYFCLPRIP
ncbi:MAG: M48 family metallopeptidase [Nitrososphaeraceae archaeon]